LFPGYERKSSFSAAEMLTFIRTRQHIMASNTVVHLVTTQKVGPSVLCDLHCILCKVAYLVLSIKLHKNAR
jgi:hypothetical protein